MTTHEQHVEDCEKKFLSKLSYYKIMLRSILGSIGVIVVIVGSVVAWSYTPIRDIATLKAQVIAMHEKLDKAIKNGKKEDKKVQKPRTSGADLVKNEQ